MYKHYHFNKIDSTSTYLKLNYNKLVNMTFVSADYQEKGHGRYNRTWYSKENENLLFSILIKDKELINKYASLSLASAVCIYEILHNLNIENVSIKWPNDVFVNDKKIAGILLESVSINNKIDALVIGVGINVNAIDFIENMENIPTSIYLENGKVTNINKFKDIVFSRFIEVLELIKNNDKTYLEVVRKNNYLKDKKVYANIENEKKIIKVIEINEDNSLKVIVDGEYVNLTSGEITFH